MFELKLLMIKLKQLVLIQVKPKYVLESKYGIKNVKKKHGNYYVGIKLIKNNEGDIEFIEV